MDGGVITEKRALVYREELTPVSFLERAGTVHARRIPAGADEPVESWLEDEYETCAIDYTSGTTGRPKGVMYHHRGAYLNAVAMAMDLRLDAESRYLWTLPMFHCNGWTITWAGAAVGAA